MIIPIEPTDGVSETRLCERAATSFGHRDRGPQCLLTFTRSTSPPQP